MIVLSDYQWPSYALVESVRTQIMALKQIECKTTSKEICLSTIGRAWRCTCALVLASRVAGVFLTLASGPKQCKLAWNRCQCPSLVSRQVRLSPCLHLSTVYT